MRHPFDHLRSRRFIRLTTIRASGQPVSTPVWFVVSGGAVYVQTGQQTGKVKRIHHNPQVTIAPCTPWGRPCGDDISATAADLGTSGPAHVRAALRRRYGPLQWLREFYLRRKGITATFLELTADEGA